MAITPYEALLRQQSITTAGQAIKSSNFKSSWDSAMQSVVPKTIPYAEMAKVSLAPKSKNSTSSTKRIPERAVVGGPGSVLKEVKKAISPAAIGAALGSTLPGVGSVIGAAKVAKEVTKMGAYNSLDDWMAGVLPGGTPVDVKEAVVKGLAVAGGAYLTKSLTGALAGANIGSRLSGIFGGRAGRKVRRARIGVRRSDYRRMSRMMTDLRRLDKFVNRIGIADLKFKRVKG